MVPSRSLLAATALFLGAATSAGSAATFGFDFLSGGVPAADGQFSFADALLGSTVSASQLSAFSIAFHDTNQPSLPNQTFNALGNPATPPPLAEGLDEGGFPYFRYNSATNTLVPFALSIGQNLLIRGGQPVSATEYRAFNLFAATPANTLGIYTEDELAVGSNFGFGFFDTVEITPIGGPVATPEPNTGLVVGVGLAGLIVAGLSGGRRRTPA